VKLHFAVGAETKEVVAMEVSTDDVHDVEAFNRLLAKAEKRRRISRAFLDGAYDSGEVFKAVEARGIEPVIRPRRNSVPDTSSPARRSAVEEFPNLGCEAGAGEKGYGRRWMAETAFSTFKRLFGEHSLSRTLENIALKLVAKVALYNMLVKV